MATDLGIPYKQAYSFGGPVAGPRVIVVHSTECPMTAGIAAALAGPNWFGGPKAGTSAHIIADPSGAVEMVHDSNIAWHVGPGGNGFTWGAEHAGRASFTAAEWGTAEGKAMLTASATAAAKVAKAHGIPARWLSIAQLRAGASGFCSHNDIRLAFGGTTHTDPGPNFPYAYYMQQVKAALGGAEPAAAPEDDLEAWMASNEDTVKAMIAEAMKGLPDDIIDRLDDRGYAGTLKGIAKGLGTDQIPTVDQVADAVIAKLDPAKLAEAYVDFLLSDPKGKKLRDWESANQITTFGDATQDPEHKLGRTDAYLRTVVREEVAALLEAREAQTGAE